MILFTQSIFFNFLGGALNETAPKSKNKSNKKSLTHALLPG